MKKSALLLLSITFIYSCSNNQSVIKTGHEGKPLPSFNLLLMDSATTINTKTIPTGKPIVLFLFNPNCPYCKAQTEEITSYIESLTGIQFCLLSNYPFNLIKNYYNKYELNRYSNIIVGQDNISYFGNYFQATAVPYLAIYDKNKVLKQVVIGKVNTNQIKDIAFQ